MPLPSPVCLPAVQGNDNLNHILEFQRLLSTPGSTSRP